MLFEKNGGKIIMKQAKIFKRSLALSGTMLMCSILLVITSCASSVGRNAAFKGGTTISGTEGWKDKHTYVLVVSGQWDRSRYYVEDEEEPKEGKEAKPGIVLEQNALRAAQEQAKRDFLEKVIGSSLKAATGTVNGKLVDDVINSGVSGKVSSPIAVVSQYTKRHDVRVTYQFKARNLKDLIDDAVKNIIAAQK